MPAFFRVLGMVAVVAILFMLPNLRVLAEDGGQHTEAADEAQSIIGVIRTDHPSYSLADTVRLDFSLQNTGDKTVYVDRRMFWGGLAGGLKLVISDQGGKPVPPPILMDALMPPPKEGDTSILIRLDPGFSYGTWMDLPVRKHFYAVGKYSIQVVYQSRLPKESVHPSLRGLPALWADAAQIHSALIWITVTR
jgi:hypothetical protein